MSFPSLPAGPAWVRDTLRGNIDPACSVRALPADERGWIPWTAAERESFFDAIARHRRASWRITFACALAITVLALVIAVLLSPLLVCLLGLAVDVVNLAIPLPDPLGRFGHWIDPLFDEKTFSWLLLFQATSVAAIPGLAGMAVAVLALHRALQRSPLFDAGELPGRSPTRAVLAEQRLLNVVEEMALAAGIAQPHVRIVPGGINAAVFGRDESHTTILVGEGLLRHLDRAQMQGAMAHLIASIAGGDMPIGLRAALTFALFGLLARLTSCLGDRREFYGVARMLRTLVWPTRATTEKLIGELANPFRPSDNVAAAKAPRESQDQLTWREWAMMPLMGPVAMTGFISGIVSTSLLNPLVAFAWRRRKYMADAAAVRLTRDPDTLAAALHEIIERGGTGLQAWTQHMAIAQRGPAGTGGLLGGQLVSIFPSTERRYKALGRMGAAMRPIARKRPAWPFPIALLIGALGVLVGGLLTVAVVLMVWLSVALSGLFTIMPAAMIHALLRWMSS